MSFRQTNKQQQISISLHVLSERHRQSNHRPKAILREAQRGAWEAEQEDPYNLSGLLLNGTRISFFDKASGMTPLHNAVLAGHELPTWHLQQ
jgi:hypothetical protein